MTLQEAFEAIEDLPVRERLLVACFADDGFRWSAGHVEQIEILDGIANHAIDAIDEYRRGDLTTALMITLSPENEYVLVVMGPESPEAISHLLNSALDDMAKRHGH